MNFAAKVCLELFFHSRDFKFAWSIYCQTGRESQNTKLLRFRNLADIMASSRVGSASHFHGPQRVPRVTLSLHAIWKSFSVLHAKTRSFPVVLSHSPPDFILLLGEKWLTGRGGSFSRPSFLSFWWWHLKKSHRLASLSLQMPLSPQESPFLPYIWGRDCHGINLCWFPFVLKALTDCYKDKVICEEWHQENYQIEL